MMLTGAPTIRDVVLFPLLKRKERARHRSGPECSQRQTGCGAGSRFSWVICGRRDSWGA
jgi:hypothetical protein